MKHDEQRAITAVPVSPHSCSPLVEYRPEHLAEHLVKLDLVCDGGGGLRLDARVAVFVHPLDGNKACENTFLIVRLPHEVAEARGIVHPLDDAALLRHRQYAECAQRE